MRVLIGLAVALVVAGCGSRRDGTPPHTAPATSSGSTACATVYGHLQQVTQALNASSELLTNSVDKSQLTQRIGFEVTQLQQSAELMGQGAVPPSLASTRDQLVAALGAFTDDFARARDAATRGDFPTAVDAMTDQNVVQRIVDASKKIEEACA
ncbi:MAG TPA: hypothetical protein VH373_05655 [Jatrophihabitantaceae bacterium]|jgi:hypothetical protein